MGAWLSLCLETHSHKLLWKQNIPAPQAPLPTCQELAAVISAQVRLSHSLPASDLASASVLIVETREKSKGHVVLCEKRTMPDSFPVSVLF